MPNVNLTDSRNRDAVVKAETTGVDEEVRYVDDENQPSYTRKILKATVEQDFETLLKNYEGDVEALGTALVEGDPEVDMEICGHFLWGVSKVYVDSSDGIVYRIEQQEIVRGPDGSVREKRPRNRPEANVDSEIPLTWTDRKFDKDEAVRRFVFASKLQIVHINGLTYDFLYGMAKELAESNSLMMVGGGSKGRDPLVFRRGSVPYRGFLEGRVDGDKYLLLLHLSNLELKVPTDSKKKAKTSDKEASTDVATKKTKKAAEKADDKPVESKKTPDKKKSEAEVIADSEAKPQATKAKKKTTTRKKTSAKQTPEKSVAEKKATDKPASQKNDNVEVSTTITSDDLGVWLKSIRMGKYLKLFIEHEIDVDVLQELTDDDLKELDIPLGSRRRLLKAVEETDNLHAEVALAVNRMTTAVKPSGKAVKQKK